LAKIWYLDADRPHSCQNAVPASHCQGTIHLIGWAGPPSTGPAAPSIQHAQPPRRQCLRDAHSCVDSPVHATASSQPDKRGAYGPSARGLRPVHFPATGAELPNGARAQSEAATWALTTSASRSSLRTCGSATPKPARATDGPSSRNRALYAAYGFGGNCTTLRVHLAAQAGAQGVDMRQVGAQVRGDEADRLQRQCRSLDLTSQRTVTRTSRRLRLGSTRSRSSPLVTDE
jgi:hypothetical protein